MVRVKGVHTLEDSTFSVITTEATIGDLHPFYSYNFSLATVTSSHGAGPFGEPVIVMMPSLGKNIYVHCSYNTPVSVQLAV